MPERNFIEKHERQPNRWSRVDYSRPGCYFITICVQDMAECFGLIKNGKMFLNQYGRIVRDQWLWLAQQYEYIKLDAFVIMPNHMHGIIIIKNNVGKTDVGTTDVGTTLGLSLRSENHRGLSRQSLPQPEQRSPTYYRQKNLLSKTICAFKTTSSKLIHRHGLPEFQWQRSFYDRIIRDQRSLLAVRRYISNNPDKWWQDRNNWINY
jgi:REP element-mobilizing transposase RayT